MRIVLNAESSLFKHTKAADYLRPIDDKLKSPGHIELNESDNITVDLNYRIDWIILQYNYM